MTRSLQGAVLSDLQATRFAGWRAWPARLALAGLAALVVYGLVLAARPGTLVVQNVPPEQSDLVLYRAIAARVAAGENYYAAATAEQRAEGYPLRPFVTVRPPTLATVQATLGPIGSRLLLCGLAGLTWVAFRRRVGATLAAGGIVTGASALSVAGLLPLLNAALPYWHDAWAGALILLSIALRSRERWTLAVLAGLLAVAMRELALPYLGAMAVIALAEGNRREAGAWAAAILASAVMIAAHAGMVGAYVTDLDRASPGWGAAGGWTFILSMVLNSTVMVLAPAWAVALVVPLCLLGWAAWPGPLGARGALVLGGYACAFLVIGRADNTYWGMMLGPLLLPGLAFVPGALRDLVAAARPAPDQKPALAA